MVRLKAIMCNKTILEILSFNSTMVRLKDQRVWDLLTTSQRFNSTMVRLKARWSGQLPEQYYRFQFHNGSIKSDLGSGDYIVA